MSGRISSSFVDFAAFFVRLCSRSLRLIRSFLVPNWCGSSAIENLDLGRASCVGDNMRTQVGPDSPASDGKRTPGAIVSADRGDQRPPGLRRAIGSEPRL